MNSLKKTVAIIGMCIFALFSLCSEGRGAGLKLNFKFVGGINYQLFGDGDAVLRAQKAYTDYYINASGGDYTSEQSIFPLVAHFGFEFDADAILYLSPQFGISIGTGYVRGGTLFGSGNQIVTSSSGTENDTNDVGASAIPIKVGIYYHYTSNSYLFGGIGFYSASYSRSENFTFGTYYSTYSETSTAHGIGFYAGWGGESRISPNFAFLYEISLRYANIGGFTGTWQNNVNGTTSSGTGKLYYYEYVDSGNGHWYPWTSEVASAPSGSGFRNAREAMIDFSGVGFRIGLKINI